MKKLLLLLVASTFILCYSCKKKDTNTQTTPFVFSSLTASDTIVVVNASLHIVAVASGDDLTYSWTSADMDGNNYGTIIGSGSDVQWSICHSSHFKVNCTVADKYNNSGTKSVYIHSTI